MIVLAFLWSNLSEEERSNMKKSQLRLVLVLAMLALAAIACSNLLSSAGSGSGRFSEVDGYSTTLEQTISYNSAGQATLTSLSEAHNWDFQGNGGDVVTITVTSIGGTDPRAKLLDSNGNVLAEDDDSLGNYGSLITYTLPSTGTYTVRIDVYTGGTYEILVAH